MACAVEAHMFQKMGQSALVFLLLNRAYTLCYEKIRTVGRPVVMADIVRKSVRQCACVYRRVHRYRYKGLRRTDNGGKGCCNNEFQFHTYVIYYVCFRIQMIWWLDDCVPLRLRRRWCSQICLKPLWHISVPRFCLCLYWP